MDENGNDWDDFIDGALFAINLTNVSSTTKFSCFFVMFGRQPRRWKTCAAGRKEDALQEYIDKMVTTRNVTVFQGRTQHNTIAQGKQNKAVPKEEGRPK